MKIANGDNLTFRGTKFLSPQQFLIASLLYINNSTYISRLIDDGKYEYAGNVEYKALHRAIWKLLKNMGEEGWVEKELDKVVEGRKPVYFYSLTELGQDILLETEKWFKRYEDRFDDVEHDKNDDLGHSTNPLVFRGNLYLNAQQFMIARIIENRGHCTSLELASIGGYSADSDGNREVRQELVYMFDNNIVFRNIRRSDVGPDLYEYALTDYGKRVFNRTIRWYKGEFDDVQYSRENIDMRIDRHTENSLSLQAGE